MMYTGTLLVVLLASAAVLRLAMREALRRGLDESVTATAELMGQFFRVEIAEYQTIDATLTHIASELVFEDRAIRIRRPDGSEFSVVGAPRAPSPRVFVPPVGRLVVPLEPALAPGWTIEVEASGAAIAAVEARLDRWIALGIPALLLLAAGTGWWLTGRTLRPVGRMADAAARIGPGDPDRIPIDDATDELGRLGTRFNGLLDRLDGALAQQRRFLADAAHELRTPLARVRGRVELAMLPVPALAGAVREIAPRHDEAASAEVLPAVHDELVRMSVLVDELLQLARADAGEGEASPSTAPVFLDDLATEELHRFHADADRAQITLHCSSLQEAPLIGDAVLLRRLIGILLDNAIRYGHARGQVDVRITNDGHTICVEIEDDGIGIAPEERARVTERFYRGVRARALRSDGSGLGLAIASWIVQRHRGTIDFADGAGGVGTRIRVSLPAAPAAA